VGGALSRRDTTARQQGDTHHAPALLYSSITVAQVSKHVSVFKTAHSFPPVEMGRHEDDASHLLSAHQVGAASVNRDTVPCTSRHPPRTLLHPSGCTRVSEQCCIGTGTRYAVCTPRGALSTQGGQACGGRGHVGPSTAAAAIQRALSTSSCDAAHRAACEDTHTTSANACERWCCVAMRHRTVDAPLRPQ
jgi:hypothetical protein